MAKMKVHELAKELNVPSRDVIAFLEGSSIEVKSHMSDSEIARRWCAAITEKRAPRKRPLPPEKAAAEGEVKRSGRKRRRAFPRFTIPRTVNWETNGADSGDAAATRPASPTCVRRASARNARQESVRSARQENVRYVRQESARYARQGNARYVRQRRNRQQRGPHSTLRCRQRRRRRLSVRRLRHPSRQSGRNGETSMRTVRRMFTMTGLQDRRATEMAEVRKRISGIRKALRIIAVIPVIIRGGRNGRQDHQNRFRDPKNKLDDKINRMNGMRQEFHRRAQGQGFPEQ